jgi:hypothetical protein
MVHPKVLQPKMLNGRPVTVRKFVECVREYAKIFAQLDNLPEPRTLMSVRKI